MSALFTAEGDAFVPTDFSRGPWDRSQLHGGPVAALLAHQIEEVGAGDGKRIVRLTVEIERPVPVAPLHVSLDVIRPGGRIELVDAVITAGEVTVTRARALRVRVTDLDVPAADPRPVMPGPDTVAPTPFWDVGDIAYHTHAVELRFLSGKPFTGAGPAQVWIHPKLPVLEGDPLSPFQRLAAAADFGNGVSAVLDPTQWIFINPDLTITADREPVGEWIGLDARTSIDAAGIGLAQSALHDVSGEIGRAVQSLYVAPR